MEEALRETLEKLNRLLIGTGEVYKGDQDISEKITDIMTNIKNREQDNEEVDAILEEIYSCLSEISVEKRDVNKILKRWNLINFSTS